MSTLLNREIFKELVFSSSKGLCVVCRATAVDAHHILDRKLWRDGGYYLENGAAVCENCHWKCEKTIFSVELVRNKAKIKTILVPPGMDSNCVYDKWGNTLLPDGKRIPGPLFEDLGVQKILRQQGLLWLFTS